eukprot:1291620-Pyramimonas_sp.AAC.3
MNVTTYTHIDRSQILAFDQCAVDPARVAYNVPRRVGSCVVNNSQARSTKCAVEPLRTITIAA